MNKPVFKLKEKVKYQGRQGTISQIFKESPGVWRYYVTRRDGTWSVTEETLRKQNKANVGMGSNEYRQQSAG